MKKLLLKIFSLYFFLFVFSLHAALGKEAQLVLTLDEAIAMAVKSNLGFQINKTDLQSAIAAETMESDTFDTAIKSEFLHQQNNQTSISSGSDEEELSTNWSLTAQKRMLTGTIVDMSWSHERYEINPTSYALDPSYSAEISVGLSQPLIKGRSKRLQTASMEAAGKRVESTTKQLDNKELDLVTSVKNTYWNLFFFSKNIEVKLLSLKLAENLLKETKDKIETGVLAPVEIFQPESVVAKREADVIYAERMLSAAEDDLRLLINQKDWDVRIVTADQPEVIKVLPDSGKILTWCLANHPSIQSANAELEATELLAESAEDSLLPSLSVIGRAGFSGADEQLNDSIQDGLESPKFSWQAGLSFSISLENSLAKGNHISALADLRRAKLNILQLRQKLAFAVREAVRNLATSLKTLEAARKAVLASKKNLQAEEDKFEVGMATTNDVLQAQEEYSLALNSENQALVDHSKSIAELDRLKGTIKRK